MEETNPTIEAHKFGLLMADEMITAIKQELHRLDMDDEGVAEFWRGVEEGFKNV